VAGFVVVVDDEVEQVYVDRRWRGRGVAELLLRHAEAVIGQGGRRTAWLAVVAGNTRARRFYARLGWQDRGSFTYQAPDGDGHVRGPRPPLRARGRRRMTTRSALVGRSRSIVKGIS
jgi:ribosomal protein S18 acetylase RimI-like enzyme